MPLKLRKVPDFGSEFTEQEKKDLTELTFLQKDNLNVSKRQKELESKYPDLYTEKFYLVKTDTIAVFMLRHLRRRSLYDKVTESELQMLNRLSNLIPSEEEAITVRNFYYKFDIGGEFLAYFDGIEIVNAVYGIISKADLSTFIPFPPFLIDDCGSNVIYIISSFSDSNDKLVSLFQVGRNGKLIKICSSNKGKSEIDEVSDERITSVGYVHLEPLETEDDERDMPIYLDLQIFHQLKTMDELYQHYK